MASFPTNALDDSLIVPAQSPEQERMLPPVLRIRKSRQAEPRDLVDLLLTTRNCGVSDLRDKIYALLWCFRSSRIHSIEPNYSKSVTEVYREATLLCIETSNSLRLLEMARGPSAHAESWIPNFGSANDNHTLGIWRKDLEFLTPKRLTTPPGMDAGRSFGTEWVAQSTKSPQTPLLALYVRAWSVEMIERAMEPLERNWESQQILLEDHEKEAIDEVLKNQLPDTLAPEIASQKGASRLEVSFGSIFERVFLSQRTYGYDGTDDLPVTICETGLPQGLLHRVEPLTLGSVDSGPVSDTVFINYRCKNIHGLIYRMLSRHGKHRKFFTTKLHIGIGPLDTVEGDEVYYLEGLETPLILRKQEKNFVVVGECLLFEVSSRGICAACGRCVGCGHAQYSTEFAQHRAEARKCRVCSIFSEQSIPWGDLRNIALV